jgi:hypothetical protein
MPLKAGVCLSCFYPIDSINAPDGMLAKAMSRDNSTPILNLSILIGLLICDSGGTSNSGGGAIPCTSA